MGKRLKIEEHLPLEEVERRYKKAGEATASRHWQVIWRLQGGQSSQNVAQEMGLSLEWVRVVARRYNFGGAAGLGDRRRLHRGRAPLLDEESLGELKRAVSEPVPDVLGGGLWNGPKVVLWMQSRLGRPIAPRLGSVYLQKVGYSVQVPRPRHVQGDPHAQQEFKKNSTKKSRLR